MYWDPLPTVRTLAESWKARRAGFFRGRWEDRNWRNVPGPIYGADTDTCWCGRQEAPRHVMYDDEWGQEFIFRPPQTPDEVRAVLEAAWADPFGGYAVDGDSHWTPATVREWWQDRARLRTWATNLMARWSISDHEQEREASVGLRDILFYVDNEMKDYLRGYVFWLSEGRTPQRWEALPAL